MAALTEGPANVFVSGGAGFIGSHLVRRLLRDGNVERVVIFDNFSSGKRSQLDEVAGEPRLQIIEEDLKEIDAVKRAMAGCQTVFHLAANPDIAKAVSQPDIDFWEGTYLTLNILEAMRAAGARKIFYASGSGVYGENPAAAFREEYGPCLPISTYGASKLACEALIASYCHMFDLSGRSFRFANVVGPRQTHGVGHDFIRRLKLDPTRLEILGDGSQRKSYIHIDDVLTAIEAGDAATDGGYAVFNVATDDDITARAIADLAVRISGLEPNSVRYEFRGGDRGWKGDVPVVRLDCSRIKASGWKCHRNSAEAVSASLAAMRKELDDE